MKLAAPLAFALALGLATPVLSAPPALPDGTYTCVMGQYIQGDIEIIGNTYKGPAYDRQYDGTYTFEVSEEGVITWHGPVGAYTQEGIQLIASTVVDMGGGELGIQFSIRLEGSDNIHWVQCLREG